MILTPTLIAVLPIIAAAADLPVLPTADDVVAKMVARDNERQAGLRGFVSTRRYVLENRAHQKRAEMLVRMICAEDGSKQFEVVGESGWVGARKLVFPRLLDAEREAARPDVREQSRIIPANYKFEMVGMESVRDKPAYILAIEPKTANKYLSRGRIWVDAGEYAIVRVDGKPAKNPSFWIKNIHFVHDYDKTGDFWFPASDRSVTDVRVFGATEMAIEYFDFMPNASPASPTPDRVRSLK